jgi:hypothetical protein
MKSEIIAFARGSKCGFFGFRSYRSSPVTLSGFAWSGKQTVFFQQRSKRQRAEAVAIGMKEVTT